MIQALIDVLAFLDGFNENVLAGLAVFLAAYLFAIGWYWRHAPKDPDAVLMQPIVASSHLPHQPKAHLLGAMLGVEMRRMDDVFSRQQHNTGAPKRGEPIHEAIRGMETGLAEIQEAGEPLDLDDELVKALGKETISWRGVPIKLSTVFAIVRWVFLWMPVPHKRAYVRSLVRVRLEPSGQKVLVSVEAGRRAARPLGGHRAGRGSLFASQPVGSVTDYTGVMRDAAFMVMQLRSKQWGGHAWKALRDYAAGLESLDRYRSTGEASHYDAAERGFASAVRADATLFEANYFYASLLLARRTQDSIDMASHHFQCAAASGGKRLRALALTGLSNCYLQRYHRLGRRSRAMLDKAERLATEAEAEWNLAAPKRTNAWIVATHALCLVVDEGEGHTPELSRGRFVKGIRLFAEAIAADPANPMLKNNLGWALLKLDELGVGELTPDEVAPPAMVGSTAMNARLMLDQALDQFAENKLAHANLCLVYARPFFRTTPEAEASALRLAVHHGLKAVEIDPGYINGHRDLAFTLVRFGRLDDALVHYEKALELALDARKDEDLIRDARSLMQECDVPAERRGPWIAPTKHVSIGVSERAALPSA